MEPNKIQEGSDHSPQITRGMTGWWAIWIVTFLVSLIPPTTHHLRGVPDILEPFRYQWGLMPGDLLFLRHLGDLSLWIPLILVGILIISITTPTIRKPLICTGACVTAVMSSFYAGYCIIVITTYLPSYSNAMEGRADILQELYAKPIPLEADAIPNP